MLPSPRGCGKTQLHSSNNNSSISVYEITLAVLARGFGWKCICGLPAGRSEQRFSSKKHRVGWQIVAAWIRTVESWESMLSSRGNANKTVVSENPGAAHCHRERLLVPSAGYTRDLKMESTQINSCLLILWLWFYWEEKRKQKKLNHKKLGNE